MHSQSCQEPATLAWPILPSYLQSCQEQDSTTLLPLPPRHCQQPLLQIPPSLHFWRLHPPTLSLSLPLRPSLPHSHPLFNTATLSRPRVSITSGPVQPHHRGPEPRGTASPHHRHLLEPHSARSHPASPLLRRHSQLARGSPRSRRPQPRTSPPRAPSTLKLPPRVGRPPSAHAPAGRLRPTGSRPPRGFSAACGLVRPKYGRGRPGQRPLGDGRSRRHQPRHSSPPSAPVTLRGRLRSASRCQGVLGGAHLPNRVLRIAKGRLGDQGPSAARKGQPSRRGIEGDFQKDLFPTDLPAAAAVLRSWGPARGCGGRGRSVSGCTFIRGTQARREDCQSLTVRQEFAHGGVEGESTSKSFLSKFG